MDHVSWRAAARNRLIALLLLCALAWLVSHHAPAAPGAPSLANCSPSPALGPCNDAARHAFAANRSAQILHAPSIGVRAIQQALAAAASPLADSSLRRDGRTCAQYIWDAGRAAGVDPAVFMGMFNVESHYGSEGIARETHSPGNMRAKEGEAAVGGYAYYPDWFAGIDATYALLRDYAIHGAPTVDTAIPVWAPSSDHNDPAAYIAAVKETMASMAALNS